MFYNLILQIVGCGGGLRTWSGGKPSSHKLIPSGVSSGLPLSSRPYMKSKTSKRNSKEPPEANKTLLGQILVELGYITIYQLDEALHIQRQDSEAGKEQKPLGGILLELGYCNPNQLIRAIQVQVELRKAKEVQT